MPFGGVYKRERYYGKKGCENCKIIFKQLFHTLRKKCPECKQLTLTADLYMENEMGPRYPMILRKDMKVEY